MPARNVSVGPVWIGIQGGTCSGKTTLANALVSSLGPDATLVICLDLFYHSFDRQQYGLEPTAYNFDHPASIDWDLIRQVCQSLNSGESATLPAYDYVSGYRSAGQQVDSVDYIILEGLWPSYDDYLLDLFHLLVYIDAPAELRLVRRLSRDVLGESRGWKLEEILAYYLKYERPSHIEFVEPGRAVSHLVVSGEGDLEAEVSRVLRELAAVKGES